MAQENAPRGFNLILESLCENLPPLTRSQLVTGLLLEAYYSSHDTPHVKDYTDLLRQVTYLLSRDWYDTRPIQMMYTYLVQTGSDHLWHLLQDVGQMLVDVHHMNFDYVEHMLNSVVIKRIAAVGRMRAIQRGDHYPVHHATPGYPRQEYSPISAQHMMRGQIGGGHYSGEEMY